MFANGLVAEQGVQRIIIMRMKPKSRKSSAVTPY
jgi:hypothetical protein